jgi:3-methyladenine DNA glycosylase AlkD
MTLYQEILTALQFLVQPEKAVFYPKYFKTGKGEYGEGDCFLGVVNPDCRAIVKAYWKKFSPQNIEEILHSDYHEMRLVALLIMVMHVEKSKEKKDQEAWVSVYLKNTKYINNWDLVDLSCYKILGSYCFENKRDDQLRTLSNSDNMWEKRIAVVATMHYIKKGKSYDLTQELVLNNLHHPHDLMHKANGWLLREIGNKDLDTLLRFLQKYYKTMPRTSLRYAIEKLDENLSQDFLKGRV